MKSYLKEALEVADNCLLSKYNSLYSKFLENLSPHTRDIIRKNKELNELFDLFLDFILDTSQHLDYKQAKKLENQVDKETVA